MAEAEWQSCDDPQIGGQLQHPSVMTVYEPGRFDDDRPLSR
jgi:hypothetical protein